MSGNSRQVRAASNTTLSIIGLALILIAVNYLGMRHYVRADWTSSGMYTLSEKSEKMLRQLPHDVQIFCLWSKGDPRFLDVKELLDRYTSASPHIHLEVIDPDRNPDRLDFLIQRYGAKMKDMGGGMMAIEASIIIVSEENVKFVSAADFEDLASETMGEHSHEEGLERYKAEQAISSAVLSVTSDKQVKVCFSQGHEEWAYEGFGGRGLGHLKEGLIQDGYKVAPISTTGSSRVPKDCDLLVIVSPQRGFSEEEVAIVDRYLTSGGRLLLALDPLIDKESYKSIGLETLTAKYGIGIGRDIIIELDTKRLVSASPLMFTASQFSTHEAVSQLALPSSVGQEIQEAIGVYPVLFSMVRSLSQKEDTKAIAQVLAKTSADAFGEVDLSALGSGSTVPEKDPADTAGPAILAMASTLPGRGDEEKVGRMVVVGDADFLLEEFFVNASLNNRDFWSGLVGWLTERGDLISIAPKNPEHVRLSLSEDDMATIWQVVIGEILFFLVLGVLVWMKRRS